MSNEIKIFRYIGVKSKKQEIPSSQYIDLAFATMNNKRLMLLVSEQGLEAPNAPAVLIEYRNWGNNFSGPYAAYTDLDMRPFKAHLPNGDKWFIANELDRHEIHRLLIGDIIDTATIYGSYNDTNPPPPDYTRAFMIFKMS